MPGTQGIEPGRCVFESMSAFALRKHTNHFTEMDFDYLAFNEKNRYAPDGARVAHAVIFRDQNQCKTACQYLLSRSTGRQTPEICLLTGFREIHQSGKMHYQARGADGSTWYSHRQDQVLLQLGSNQDAVVVELAWFSEEEQPNLACPFDTPRFIAGTSVSTPPVIKGGQEMILDHYSVSRRDFERQQRIRVMPGSARDACQAFYTRMQDQLSPALKFILNRSITAHPNRRPECNFFPEWLHAYAVGLAPLDIDPQCSGNIGAAGKWVNTEMLFLERLAKWFVLNDPKQTRVVVKSRFEMLGQSELISKVRFEVKIEFRNKVVHFIKNLDAFMRHPMIRKASDLAQATGIIYAILNGQPLISQEAIIVEARELNRKRRFEGSQSGNSNHAARQVFFSPRHEDSRDGYQRHDGMVGQHFIKG